MDMPKSGRGRSHPSLWEANVDYSVTESGCWKWLRRTGKDGYPNVIYIDGKYVLPHRASYRYKHGGIGKGLTLDHLCRERSCVNPDHLEPCPISENSRRGSNAKLRQLDADMVRKLYPDVSAKYLSQLLGVSLSTIYAIVAKRLWSDVPVGKNYRFFYDKSMAGLEV